jgi:hypothetical protein
MYIPFAIIEVVHSRSGGTCNDQGEQIGIMLVKMLDGGQKRVLSVNFAVLWRCTVFL